MKFEFKQNLENFLDLWQLLGCEPPGIVVSVSERDLLQGQLLFRFVRHMLRPLYNGHGYSGHLVIADIYFGPDGQFT